MGRIEETDVMRRIEEADVMCWVGGGGAVETHSALEDSSRLECPEI